MNTTTTKQCRTCGDTLVADTTNFQKASSQPDGLWPECKTCANAYQAVWRTTKAVKGIAADTAPEQVAKLNEKAIDAIKVWEARQAMGVGRIEGKRAPKQAAATDDTVVDGTAAQAEAIANLEATLAANGGAETDAGQQVLAAAAQQALDARRKADRERKARQRAAAKAAKAQA